MGLMDILELYKETGALLEGHFLLASGRHSSSFMQSCTLLQHPIYCEAIGLELGKLFEESDVDFVVGPAMGGVTLGFATAKGLGVKSIFAEKDGKGGMFIREGLTVNPGENFIAVEDVLTTGGSVAKAIKAAEAKGATCIGVGSIVDRSSGQADFGVPYRSLITMDFPTYDASDCPLCKAGLELVEV